MKLQWKILVVMSQAIDSIYDSNDPLELPVFVNEVMTEVIYIILSWSLLQKFRAACNHDIFHAHTKGGRFLPF